MGNVAYKGAFYKYSSFFCWHLYVEVPPLHRVGYLCLPSRYWASLEMWPSLCWTSVAQCGPVGWMSVSVNVVVIRLVGVRRRSLATGPIGPL